MADQDRSPDSAAPRIRYFDKRNVTDTTDLADYDDRAALINGLSCEIGPRGWLSTLVWNISNRFLAHPDGTFTAGEMRMVVDGFLAEIAAMKEAESARTTG